MTINNKIINDTTNYYEGKLREYGPTSRGVDWNSKESQELRFRQLMKVVKNHNGRFTILDFGCGYGALFDYLKNNYQDFDYTGFDVSKAMIDQAKKLHPDLKNSWVYSIEKLKKFDFVIASGLFNVKLNYNDKEWLQYVLKTLKQFNELCLKGFSFNVLTKYSDKECMKENLYYADPLTLFDWCKKEFSEYVSLLHDYSLYQFSVIVKKI